MSLLKPYQPPTTTRTALCIIIEALEKAGKTRLALTGKRGLAYFSFDRPPDYLLRKKSKGVLVADCRPKTIPDNADSKKASDIVKPLWEEFLREYYKVVTDPIIKTIVIDTASVLWELVRLAEFGKLTQVPPVMYAKVNTMMARMMSVALSVNKDVLWLCRLTEEWKMTTDSQGRKVSEKTDKLVREGWKNLGFEAEATVRLSITPRGTYKAVITASGYGGLGTEFEDEDITLENIRQAILSEEE